MHNTVNCLQPVSMTSLGTLYQLTLIRTQSKVCVCVCAHLNGLGVTETAPSQPVGQLLPERFQSNDNDIHARITSNATVLYNTSGSNCSTHL